jgi:hypothetical protein
MAKYTKEEKDYLVKKAKLLKGRPIPASEFSKAKKSKAIWYTFKGVGRIPVAFKNKEGQIVFDVV